ncbi:MAG: ABC transporter substrate-binding protein [Rhodoglobus sp.]
MRIGRIVAASAVMAASVALLSACVSAPSTVVHASRVTVASDDVFTSLNPLTESGSGSANTEVAYATNAGFTYYTDAPELAKDESFGSYRIITEDPLTVRYTVTDGVRWSDGTAVDAADLLLSWAAASDAFNDSDFDRSTIIDEQTGDYVEGLPADVVYFDSQANQAMQLVTTIPEMSSDRRSITLTFDDPFADWEGAFYAMGQSGPPAHVVAKLALDVSDAQEAKDAVVHSILDEDTEALSRISDVWNRSFALTELPENEDLLVSSGPYSVSDFLAGQYVTLTANPSYVGDHQPSVEQIMIRYIPDPLAAVQALSTGEVNIISPEASDGVLSALGTLDLTMQSVPGPDHDSIELVVQNGKSTVFEDERVRAAFLLTIPRDEILESVFAPIAPGGVIRNSFALLPGSPGYAESVSSNGSDDFASVDIDTAQELLAEAGVTTPEVCILYPAGDPLLTTEFELIRDSAARAGIAVTDCSSEDWPAAVLDPSTHDAVLSTTRTSSLGLSDVARQFETDSEDNHTGFSSVRVDSLATELESEVGRTPRLGLAERLDSLLFSARYGLPIVQRPIMLAFDSAAVLGVSRSPLAPGVLWNVWDWQPPAVVEG